MDKTYLSKRDGAIMAVLCLLALMLSTYNLTMLQKLDTGKDVQYVMYLGTNDKDTNKPVYTPDQAKEKAQEILLDHFGGYTIQEANGGWIDGDIVYTEYTLVIYLSDTDLESVHAAADDMIKAFNQSSVLIQANTTTTEFYAG
ncbi:MAG: hypothetical protein Q4D71_05260 [Oscillospiraceae bacterium]|nr:hypothetical protein [Oscillospiraceae bacterium]MDO5137854.1 hypothetical protein [Oscillospiraceae bacterium]